MTKDERKELFRMEDDDERILSSVRWKETDITPGYHPEPSVHEIGALLRKIQRLECRLRDAGVIK